MKTARPPVVAIMGHIDHGKSTLLDYIRKQNTVEGEAGGITQHVAAYEIVHKTDDGKENRITFLDTPGHEAFQSIRARGARAADIAVLVVSAEDGVKPQTIEALKRIREEEVPMFVAITKIDKPSANVEMAKQSLAENDVYVEGYGGDVPVVAISAKTGAGVKEFLDVILLLGEIEHCTGYPERTGAGVIIESRLDPKKGITAVGVIKDGSVRVGQVAASIGTIAPLRYILNADGEKVDQLSFSSPIQIIGWDKLPLVGATFEIFENKKAAQLYADSEAVKAHIPKQEMQSASTLDENTIALPIIIKADAAGSLEAILYELGKIQHERIQIKIVSADVGTISESDMKAAQTTPGTYVFGFNTKIDPQAGAVAERTGIPVELYEIIYQLTERVTGLLLDKAPRLDVEEVMGRAKVLKLFSQTKDKQVIGARMESGMFEKGSQLKIIRRETEVGRGKVKELQQGKVSVDNISEGAEFGTMIESKVELAPGDYLERVVTVTK